jgi:hypothetical protein
METSLTVTTDGLTQVAARPREVLHDPLAGSLAGQLPEHARRAFRHDVGRLLVLLGDGAPTAWGVMTREAHDAVRDRPGSQGVPDGAPRRTRSSAARDTVCSVT